MKVIFKYSFIAIVLLSFFFCKKKKKEITNYDRTNPIPLENYCYFKMGSYWVLEDSVTKIIDSLYVVSSEKGIKTIKPEDNLGYQGNFGWFKVRMRSSRDHYEYEHWTDRSLYLETSKNVPVFRDRYATGLSGYNTGSTFLMCDDKSRTIYRYPGEINFQGSVATFTLNDSVFYNVEKWSNSKSAADDYQTIYFYIAEHVGITKKILIDSNKVWKLLRYKVIQ